MAVRVRAWSEATKAAMWRTSPSASARGNFEQNRSDYLKSLRARHRGSVVTEAEVWMFILGLFLGAILGVVFDRLWTQIAGERHKLVIKVESDGRETGGTQTFIYLKNTGSFFERDVRLNIEAATSKDDSVRFPHVQSETNDQVKIERTDTRSEANHFKHFNLSVGIDGMERKDVILVVAISTHYIPTLKVDAISNATTARYNSLKQ